MLNVHRSLCTVLVLTVIVTSGCSMSANKYFSWLKPKNETSPDPATLAQNQAGQSEAGQNEAAQTDAALAGDSVSKDSQTEAALAANANKLAVLPVSASKKLSPIQSELSKFQPFPFDVDMVDVEGRPIRLQDFRGKVVIVDLWGTWCGPCRRVIPHLVKLQQEHPQDLQVIGLCNERTTNKSAATARLRAAMADFKINYPCVLIDDNTTRKVPNFSGYPTMLFIDRAGTVRMSTVGVKPEAYWDALIAELLAS